jgi:hypothetical protein
MAQLFVSSGAADVAARGATGQNGREEPADGSLGWQAGGCCKGVQTVARGFLKQRTRDDRQAQCPRRLQSIILGFRAVWCIASIINDLVVLDEASSHRSLCIRT